MNFVLMFKRLCRALTRRWHQDLEISWKQKSMDFRATQKLRAEELAALQKAPKTCAMHDLCNESARMSEERAISTVY